MVNGQTDIKGTSVIVYDKYIFDNDIFAEVAERNFKENAIYPRNTNDNNN